MYDKIDKTDFLDKNFKYYRKKSDAFIHYALVELAGTDHMVKIDEPVYFYDTANSFHERKAGGRDK